MKSGSYCWPIPKQLQGSLDQIVVEGSADDREKARQGLPMALHIGYRFPQRTVGFHQALVDLLLEPALELVQNWLAIGLMVHQALHRAHLLLTGLVVMVE